MRTCELVALAFAKVKEEYRDPNKIRSEFSTTTKTAARDLLQEHSGQIITDKISSLAGRCATCGPLAAVAGYDMKHFLINSKVGYYYQIKHRIEGGRGFFSPRICVRIRGL